MPAKVFVSCGQSTDEERAVARSVADILRAEGFDPYVATQVQTIRDLNSEIIGELKRSDYFLFLNFRRERLENGEFRGSLFAHQELAIAYSLGFEKMLFLSQVGVRREGMLGFMVSNIPEFEANADLPQATLQAIRRAAWLPSYSRNLLVQGLRWGQPVNYTDQTGQNLVQVLHADIVNRRPDQGAIGTLARLASIVEARQRKLSPDRSHLKCSGYPGYEQTILPESHGAFDLLAVMFLRPPCVALNSALDVRPRAPLICQPGTHILEFEVFAQSFPVLEFAIEIEIVGRPIGRSIFAVYARFAGTLENFICSADAVP